MKSPSPRHLLLAAATLVAASSAHAADFTWNGSVGADWHTAGNWTPGTVPGGTGGATTDRAIFDGVGSQNAVTFGTLVGTSPNSVGGSSGFGGILVTGNQTSALSINSSAAGSRNFRFAANAGIAIESGAGAFSMGTSGTVFQLVLQGTPTIATFQNDSANTATLGDKITILHGGNQTSNLRFAGSGDWDVASVIQGANMQITKIGTGTTTLSGANSYAGPTTISSGVLQATTLANSGTNSSIGAGTAAPTHLVFGSATSTLRYIGSADTSTNRGFTLSSGAGGGATIESSGAGTLTIATSGLGTINYGTADETRVLTLGGTNTGANTFVKVIGDNGAGATSLTKAGAGKWVLSGANTYTGGTIVSAGTLNAANNTALGNGAVSVAGGTLAIDDAAVGQVTLGTGANLAMSAGKIAIDITGAATFDTIVGTGTGQFLLTGGTLELTGFSGFESGSYNLLSGFAGTGNDVTGLNITGYDTNNWLASLNVATGTLSFQAIPEPSTYGLIGAGALAAAAMVRRRRKHAGAVAA